MSKSKLIQQSLNSRGVRGSTNHQDRVTRLPGLVPHRQLLMQLLLVRYSSCIGGSSSCNSCNSPIHCMASRPLMRIFAIQATHVFTSPPSLCQAKPPRDLGTACGTGCATALARPLRFTEVYCRAQLGQRQVFCRTQQQELWGEVETTDIPQQQSHSHHPKLATHWKTTRTDNPKAETSMVILSVVSQI